MAWVWDDASAEHSGRTVLSLVIARCCDRAPMVRVRSLAALTSVLNSAKAEAAYPPLRAAVHELVASGERRGAPAHTRTGRQKRMAGGSETTTNALLGMISQRVHDDKAAVRRAAVQVRAFRIGISPWVPKRLTAPVSAQALEVLMLLMLDDESPASTSSVASHIHLLEASCSDKSLSTRKQAMCSLSAVVVQCPSKQRFQVGPSGKQTHLRSLSQHARLRPSRMLGSRRCYRSRVILSRASSPNWQSSFKRREMRDRMPGNFAHLIAHGLAAADDS